MKDLRQLIADNRAGRKGGVCSACSTHLVAVEAAMRQGQQDNTLVLIEATANQVNQFGGYTGMQPAEFRNKVEAIATKAGIGTDHVLLGGDHLGPTCWTTHPADLAMERARELVESYVAAGFRKIHLDTSMPCKDDPRRLSDEVVAMRAADLCQVAERVTAHSEGAPKPLYVIGTEVPSPGGAIETDGELRITDELSAQRTLEAHERAFRRCGLHQAWERVIALVVQPGLEFDNWSVRDYAPDDAQTLSAWIEDVPNLVFEAHSTDYQTPAACEALIRNHFAILKVGPELTNAVRQALFALSHIESELVPAANRANLRSVCKRAMLEQPAHWIRYCSGNRTTKSIALQFGLSDRIRYYWSNGALTQAVERLTDNLSRRDIPLPLLQQYMPLQYAAIREGRIDHNPRSLVLHHVMLVTERYARACHGS